MRDILYFLLFLSLIGTIYFLIQGDVSNIIICLVANNFLTSLLSIHKEVRDRIK